MYQYMFFPLVNEHTITPEMKLQYITNKNQLHPPLVVSTLLKALAKLHLKRQKIERGVWTPAV